MAKKPKYKSITVFQNPYLESLTHVHPIVPLLVWLPVAAFLIYRSSATDELGALPILAFGLLGFVSWSLAEYVMHRWIFHFNAVGPFQERLRFLIHGLHHDDPVDPTRLVMPPVAGAILAVILYSVFWLTLGPVWVDPFFAGFLLGYLGYDYTHYAIHHFTPRTSLGKRIKNHHMQHHFVTPDAKWGVSSPIWDAVFGSLESVAKASGKSHGQGTSKNTHSSSRSRASAGDDADTLEQPV